MMMLLRLCACALAYPAKGDVTQKLRALSQFFLILLVLRGRRRRAQERHIPAGIHCGAPSCVQPRAHTRSIFMFVCVAIILVRVCVRAPSLSSY